MIRFFKYLFCVVLTTPTVLHPMWISSVGGPLNPEYANYPITQMYKAAKAGNADKVKSLIGRVNLDQIEPCGGCTVLIAAARAGHIEIVNMVLDAGADPNGRDAGGWNVLRWLARAGKLEIIQLLIDKGAYIYHCESSSAHKTPLLMSAAYFGRDDVVRKLIDLHSLSDLYFTNNEGKSALFIAAQENHSSTCMLLVEAMLQPVREQKNKFYTLFNCLKKQVPGFVLSLRRDLFRPFLREIIREPREKVRQEIDKISNGEIKQELLERYGFE